MESASPFPSWLLTSVGLVVVYRAVMATLLGAFHALTSLHRRRLLEEEGIPNPLLAELLARPLVLGQGVTFWNQILLVLLTGLVLPLAGGLPWGGGGLLLLMLIYVWVMDLLLPSLVTAGDPALWVNRLFPLYAPIHRLLSPLVEPLSRYVERARERHEQGQEDVETTGEAVTALLEEGEAEGILEEGDRELIRNVVEFGDTVVREVMTPRTRIQAIALGASAQEVWNAFRSSRHSRLPVFEGTVDAIVGVVLLKDLLQFDPADDLDLHTLMKAPLFVPESKPVLELLREFQVERTQMAMVVDEYGSISGLVSMEDLLEEVFGEIREEHEISAELQPLSDGSLLVPGAMHVEELEALLELSWPHENFDTVAGLVLANLGRVPQPGDSVDVEGAVVAVTRMEGPRILQVRIRKVPEAPGSCPGVGRVPPVWSRSPCSLRPGPGPGRRPWHGP